MQLAPLCCYIGAMLCVLATALSTMVTLSSPLPRAVWAIVASIGSGLPSTSFCDYRSAFAEVAALHTMATNVSYSMMVLSVMPFSGT